MFNHEPAGYNCPFCGIVNGVETELNSNADIVRRTELATALISPRFWPKNGGHIMVITNAHYENLYDLPPAYGHAVHDLAREAAIAIRETYGCDGTSVRQHNEPAGYQDAWHYHVHVFPRYHNDELYNTKPLPGFADAERRKPYADRLRHHFETTGQEQEEA